MRLCTARAFRSLIYAPGSEPSIGTLRSKILAGKIPGGRIEAGRYFVDLDEFDSAHHLNKQLLERRKQLATSADLEGLL